MRIAFISQWYDPEVGSAAIPGSVVRALRHRGHEVEVVTGFPNYPSGEIYEGYRLRPYTRENRHGTVVHRVPLYPSHDASPVRRMLNFASFATSATIVGSFLARRSEVALVYSTPATVGMAGLALRHLLRRPYVLYIQDVWPDTLTATGMLPGWATGPAEWLLHKFCNRVYRSAAQIAVISPGMKTLLVERGVPAEKVDVVHNWVDEAVFRPVGSRAPRGGTFDVMYAGNIGDVQGLDVAVRALARLDRDTSVPVHLRFIGSGVAMGRLRALARELGVDDRVHFEGPRSSGEMAEVMSTAHVQLVCLKDDPLFHLTMPSKVQAILACGQPMITCAPGDAAALTARTGSGWAVPPGDVEALARTFKEASQTPPGVLAQMGASGRRYYDNHLASDVGAKSLEDALLRALGGIRAE